MAAMTVSGVTVDAVARWNGSELAVAWMPTTEGIEMTTVAVPGRRAVVTGRQGREYQGTVTRADPEDYSAWVRPDEPEAGQ